MTTVRASSDLPPLDVNGINSPRTRVGRGLESIGGMTADTFQRFTTVVGGVVKSPVALMAKVGSLASPQAASRTSPLAASRTSSQAASPTLPQQAKSPTSPEAASLTLPEAENPTSPQPVSLTSPEVVSPSSPQAASLTSPEVVSPSSPQAASLTSPEAASPILPETASLTLPETTSFNLPEAANLTLLEAASVTSSPSMSLEERVFQLEIQMKSLEERFKSGTAVTELNLSPRSLEENPRLARSLIQEMETEGTLEKRVQMLEESLHQRMESVEKALSIIQSQLAHVDLSKDESVAGYDSHDSPSVELEFYDAEQQGDGLEILEILELNSFEAIIADSRYERGEGTEASAPLAEVPAINTEPTTAELVQEIDSGRSSEPQLAHISMQCKQIFTTEPMEAAAEPVERAQELDAVKSGYVLLQPVSTVESTEAFVKEPAPSDDGGTFPVSSDRQLVSTLSELHETFMTEPSAVTASAKFLDIARADSAEKSNIAHVFFDPQSAFVPEAFQEQQQPLTATSVVDSEELAEEDVLGKSVDSESPLAPLLETPQRDSVMESLAAASSAGFAQKLAINDDSDVALTPSADLEEPVRENVAEKSGSYMLAAKESPAVSSFEEPQEDFAKEFLAAARSAGLAQVLATNEDGYMAIASSDTEVASRFAEEPSAAMLNDHFEEPVQEDAGNNSETVLAAEESPLLASSEEPEDDFVKKSLVVAPIAEPAHGLATEANNDAPPAFFEPQVASRSVEFPSAVVLNDNAEELAQEDAAVKSGTLLAAEELPLLSSFEEPQEDFMKESLAAAPSAGPARGLATEASDDVAPAFFKPQVASKSVEDLSAAAPIDNAEEPAQEDAQDKSGTLLAAEESPPASSFEEPEDDPVKEALVAGASAGPAHDLATREDSDITPAFSEPQEKSRAVEEPSGAVPSASFEEPVRDIAADKSGTVLAAEGSPLRSLFEASGEDSVKESLAGAPSAGLAHGLAIEASDDVAPAFSEPQVASRSVKFPSAAVLNDNAEELVRENAQQDAANKSEPMLAAEESPLLASAKEPEDGPVKQSLAGAPSAGLAHGLATEASDDVAPAFSEPQVTSRSVEFPSAAAPIDNAEEPGQEDAAEKSGTMLGAVVSPLASLGTMLAAVVSPLASSLQEPEDDPVKESLVAARTAVPAHGLPLQEDSGGYSDMAVPEPQAASTTVEEQSSAIPSTNFEAPAQDDAMDKDGTVLAPVVSPSAASFEEPQEGSKEEILAPAQESVTREDSDVAPASSEPQVASKFVEEPLVAIPSANFEEPAGEDADETSGTKLAAQVASPASSFEEPEGDTVKESLVDAPSAGTAHELLSQVNSSGSNDVAVAEPRVASITEEDPPTAISSANFEEPAAEKSGTIFAAEDSSSASSFGEPYEDFTKESLAAPPSAELAQKRETKEESDMARASSDIQVASRAVEEPSAAVASVNLEEPVQEDVAEKISNMLAAKESPSAEESPPASSFEEPQVDFAELLAAAPIAGPAHELAVEVNNDVAPAFSEPQVASRSVEEPSAAVPSANFEEPAQEDVAEKSGTMLAAEESPPASSFEDPQGDFMKESLAAAPSAGPARELATEASDDVAPAFSEPQVASRSVEEPSAAVPSANFEEPAHEDATDKDRTMLAAEESPPASSFEDPQGDFMKESLAVAPSAGPARGFATEASDDLAPAFSEPQLASRSVEYPSATLPNDNAEEPAQEDMADKNKTMLAAKDSPLLSSFEEPQENSAKESLTAAPSAEPAHGLAIEANDDVAPAFSEPQVASRSVEYPSTAVRNDNAEGPAQEPAADKSGTLLAAEDSPLLSLLEEPEDNLVKEALVAGASAGPAYESVTQEDSDIARASSEPQEASRSVEEPSAAVPSASFEEPVRENAADESGTLLAAEESPLLSLSEKLEDNSVKESLIAAKNAGPAHELAPLEDSNIAESHEASRFVEEPSAAVPSASFEAPAQKDGQEEVVDKSGTLLAAEESPLLSSSEEPEDNPVKESLVAAPSAGPAHELATEASDDVAPAFSEPQVASKSVEDPSAAAPIDNAEEPGQEDAAEKSGTMLAAVVSPLASLGTMLAAVVSPLTSSLQEPEDDTVKESLVAGASAKTLEPAQEEDFKNSAIAQAALAKEPSGGSVHLEGLAQEKTSTVEEPQNVPVGEDNHTPKEVEYKLAEDIKIPDEHVKDTEEVFRKSQSNWAHVSSDERKPESLVSQDSDERVESGESGEEFFDAEQESAHSEAWDSVAQKPFEESVVGLGEPGEASGSNAIAQKSFVMEPPVPAPSTEPAQELENFEQKYGYEPAQKQQLAQERGFEPAQELAREPAKFEQEPAQAHGQQPVQEHEKQCEQQTEQLPAQELVQENLAGKSDVALASSEPLVSAKFDQPQELLAEEPLAAEPRVKFEEPAQANAADESDTRDLPFAFKVEEPRIDTIGSSSEEKFSSARFYESGNPELVETLDEAGIAVHLTSAASASEESEEARVNEPMKVAPSSEYSTKPAQEGDGTATSQGPHEDFAKELSAAALSAFKSAEPEESSLAEEPRAVTPTSKLAQESGGDKSSPGLVEGSPLTSIEEEPRYGSVSSLVEGKHGQNEVVQLKAMEDVNTPPGLIEEAFPRSESDSTFTKLKPEERLESEKSHDQGSFLAFAAAPSVESKEEALEPAAKLVQLFEKEDVRKSGTVPATTFTRTEPAEQQRMTVVSSTAKVVEEEEENHGRSRRSFARSTSEPQFVYKSGDHRNAQLAKEPSVVAAPSASNLELHAQEDSADVQCLPFKLLGEGKLRKESELKMAEDVHGSARKTEPAASYVLEPKPTRIKEKKKKEKKEKEKEKERKPEAPVEEKKREKKEKEKERKHEASAEEKVSRRSFRTGEMERKGSVRGEDKDSNSSNNNNLLRSEEKHKQPFRHWRDKLRHAFGTTKDP